MLPLGRRSEMEDGMGMLEALPTVVRGGLVKAAKRCGAGVLADAAGALSYPSQRCLFGNKRADSGEPTSLGLLHAQPS